MAKINKNKTYNKSLIGKLLIVFFVFAILFLIFSIAALFVLKLETREYIIGFQKYKIEEEAERVDDFTERMVNDLKSFYVLKDDILSNDFSLTVTHIYQLFLVNRSIDAIKVISPGGDELLAVSRVGMISQEQLMSVKDEQYFKQAKNNIIFYGLPYVENKNVFADIAVPYFENFNLVAVVWAKISFSSFFNELTSETTFGEGHLHVLSGSGIVLAAPDINFIGKDISKTELFKMLGSQREILGYSCTRSCIEEHDFNTILSFRHSRHIDGGYRFIIALESDDKKVFEIYYRIRNIAIIGLAVFILLIIVFSVIIRMRIKKYLNILTQGIRDMHEGKLSERIIINTGDEIEYFADHFNHLAEDIEQKIKEKNQAIDKLKGVDILKYNFIKTVSHQLRTPISSMMWLLENLTGQISGKLTSEQADIFQDVYKANQNISRIVNDMILSADIDEGNILLEKSEANCDDVVASVIFGVTEEAREKNIKIEYQRPKESLPLCVGDMQKIKFTFSRLLDNAIKYSEKGKEIIITIRSLKDEIIFIVQDQGIGIPKDEQPLIFTKFYRTTNAYKMIQDASGLSLYISKHFINLHGGQIWFDSKEGEGSTFYFSLPLK